MATEWKTHYLDVKRKFADAIYDGRKTFEVRSLRHGIEVGDLLTFEVPGCEGHPIEGRFFDVTYELRGWGIEEGHACYAILPMPESPFLPSLSDDRSDWVE